MTTDWQPSASLDLLRQRAQLLQKIRHFFQRRNVLEVDVPLLSRYSVTDPHLDAICTDNPHHQKAPYFLQTSPEYAMKRLLAAGSGAIYYLGKAFRKGEQGSRHNPEFTMLEWYRPNFDHHKLMEEVGELVAYVLGEKTCRYLTYRDAFQQTFNVDPHCCDLAELKNLAQCHIDFQMDSDSRDDWLNLLLAEIIEPQLGVGEPTFLYDYPASQAALAKIAEDEQGEKVAQRFELYIDGVELANGYYELTDADEQLRRFEQDQNLRKLLDKAPRESDSRLLAAMQQGIPSCAGVALGVDRLLMLLSGESRIENVISFSFDRA
jgi:lysyl-tRNA synthetase class 2